MSKDMILENKYFDEYKIIDGLNQHPEGLTYQQWLEKYHPLNNKTILKVKISKTRDEYISWLKNTKWYHDPVVINYVSELKNNISELEQANDGLLLALQESTRVLNIKIKELEQQNAELKNKNVLLTKKINCLIDDWSNVVNKNREIENQKMELIDLLIEATEGYDAMSIESYEKILKYKLQKEERK